VIAVVDDDQGILKSLEYLLESANFSVCLFTSASELLESGSLREVDCLISDIDMPGIDGFELMQLIAEQRPGLPTILITGYPDRIQWMPAHGSGKPRTFTKPFQGQQLLQAIGDALGIRM
jgi:FixJ family two-component response regulator